MIKKKILLLVGIIIIIFTLSFVLTNKGILFDESSKNGETMINFEILKNNSEIKANKIKAIITDNTELQVNEIEINTNDIIIRFEFIEEEVIDKITNIIMNEYKTKLKLSGYTRIDKSTSPTRFYIIYTIIVLMVLIGLLIIFYALKIELKHTMD